MKKKIRTSFLIVGIFIVVMAVMFFVIYISPWAKKKNERSKGWVEYGFILKANEDKGSSSIEEKRDCDDFFEFCINCTELDGIITFKVYYLSNMSEDIYYNMTKDIYNDSDGLVIMQEEIEKPGIYEYDFSDFKDGFYKFELSKMDNMTSATGSIRSTTYYNNWSRLMKRLGLK